MINKRLLTEKDVDYLEKRFKKVFLTRDEFKNYRSKLFNRLDKILKEILTSRQEQKVLAGRVFDHEDRISDLETIHPQGQHPIL